MTEEEAIDHKVNRTGWEPGPWDNEPDRIEWRSAGVPRLPCLMIRNHKGAWCGYVGVPEGHPWFEQDYGAINAEDVHGGLTYSDSCAAPICHVPRAGESPHVWWVGFDCAHAYDHAPGDTAMYRRLKMRVSMSFEAYRDEAYVRAEVNALAAQAQAAAK